MRLEARSDLDQDCCRHQLVLHSHRNSGRVISFKWLKQQGCFTFVDDDPDVGSLYWPGTFRIPVSATGIRAALAQNISAATEMGERSM